jgi:hypothetical protein
MSDEEDYLLKIRQGVIPIFEILSGDKHYRIYYSGRVEGFTERVSIINQFPLVYRAVFAVAGRPCMTHHHPNTMTPQKEALSTADHPL